MRGFHNQACVTSALSDQDAMRALHLCCYLRRVFTTRQLCVVASPKLSMDLRQSLVHGFDFVFYIDEHLKPAHLNMDNFTKVYSFLVFRGFENCAYLSPTCLAIKNVDEIFCRATEKVVTFEDYDDTSVFLFEPSVENFESLLRGLTPECPEGICLGKYINEWKICLGATEKFLDRKYNIKMNPENTNIGNGLCGTSDISIINLVDYPEQDDMSIFENSGIFQKLVATHWLKIHEEVLSTIGYNYQNWPKDYQITTKCNKEPIAIVGMSCRYPGSNNLEEFWDLLFKGEDGICAPPPFRLLSESDPRKVKAGFLKVPIDEFDGQFFGISPKEILCMDPQFRMLHEIVWEALEDAWINPQSLRGSSGSVFLGSWPNDYKEILLKTGNTGFFRVYMGNSMGAAAARISFLLGLMGPSIATESGCSSTMVAVHLACRSLQNGETNLALACGVNQILNPLDKDEMSMLLAPDGRSKTFSEDANGYARAEGAGVLVLKRLSDALKDEDHIWGLIRGSAVNQEGISKSMGTPTTQCEATVMKAALREANISPEQVSYVETHGTGTPVGDPMEVAAIANAYNSKKRKDPLIIGSVKTNVGHTESCSGITGIMKVILSMHHEIIPAHRNFTNLNPAINLDTVPAIIPLEGMSWKKMDGRSRIAGVSSFGITGTDAHVIIEETPKLSSATALSIQMNDFERPVHILKLSAKSKEAMEILLQKYQEVVPSSHDDIADICYSANIGRADFPIRAAVIANTKSEFYKAFQQQNYMKGHATSEKMDKICFLFTGQGSQYPGMAKQLFDTSPVFRMHFEYCERILKQAYNIDINQVIWPKSSNANDEINNTIYSQTSIFCVEYALLKLWESWGVKPDFVLGHSLGEFAAAVCAGILSVEDALKLVAERSQLIEALPHGKMLVIRAAQPEVENLMNHFANGNKEKIMDYAAINSDEQTVVSGDPDVILEFSNFCASNNVKCIVLAASHAFHSSHMDPILDEYKAVAATIKKQRASKCGYISGVNGDLTSGRDIDAEYWVKHARDKVNFLKASITAVELGCKIFIEVGPQPVLSSLTMMNNSENLLCLPSLKKNENEWTTMLTSLGKLYVKGFEINWKGLDQFHSRKKVRLPFYPFIGKKYWPEAINTNVTNIHPLIGSPIPNASSTKLFQNNLSIKSHEYLRDHSIDQLVIFPAACHLEICLAAGLAAIHGSNNCLAKPTKPTKIENLTIVSPLALQDATSTQIQTVVEFLPRKNGNAELNTTSINIFHKMEADSNSSWLKHSHGEFAFVEISSEMDVTSLDKTKIFSLIANPGDEILSAHLYDKLASQGLNYGSHFKSIGKIWLDTGSGSQMVAKINLPSGEANQFDQYICHPIMIDAMIQAIMMLKMITSNSTKLRVPVRIGKFMWLPSASKEASLEMYIQVSDLAANESNEMFTETCSAYLLDSMGNVQAVMSGVEFICTTVKVIKSVLHQETNQMPELFEEIWRLKLDSLQHPTNLEYYPVTVENMQKAHLENNLDKLNCRPDLAEIFNMMDKLVFLNILKTMLTLGWIPVVNETFDESCLFEELNLKMEFRKQFGYFLRVLAEEGILKNVGKGTWSLIRLPPSPTEIQRKLNSLIYRTDLVAKFSPVLMVSKIGENLDGILRGTESALSILFPNETSKKKEPSAENLYTFYNTLVNKNGMLNVHTIIWMKNFAKQGFAGGHKGFVFRILEVGAGTGGYTEPFLEILETSGIEYEYTYTDISSAFFPAAEKRFEKYSKKMIFKSLNIENDPASQGFVPSSYDLVMSSEAIHATKKLSETLQNVRSLLKENGHFDLVETIRDNRFVSFSFGLLDGFWRFEDYDIRSDHCLISKNSWIKLLESNGFYVAGDFHYANDLHAFIKSRKINVAKRNRILTKDGKIWLVFHNKHNPISQYLIDRIPELAQNRDAISVTCGSKFECITENSYSIRQGIEEDFIRLLEIVSSEPGNLEGIVYAWSLGETSNAPEHILKPYFFLAKAVLQISAKSLPRLYILTSGVVDLGDGDITNTSSSLLWGFTKSMINENSHLYCKCIDVGSPTKNEEMMQIFYELWKPERETQVCFRDNCRHVAKFVRHKPDLTDLELPVGAQKFHLVLPETKLISDLQFVPINNSSVLECNEIEVQVKAFALNFLDVLSVLKPSDDFKDRNTVGFDFAAVVSHVGSGVSKWSVGDSVYAFYRHGYALPSHIRLHEDSGFAIPKGMTFCEASTLPVVMATSILGLLDVAKISASDTVLIHTASGGVGLAAIQICKRIGSTIIATAGSKRKQNYLKSLGIEHIFNSRNIQYENEIMNVTNGRGVDVVLNSLTGEGFKEATLNVCAKGARFVEMSKMSIWQPEEVRKLRPDVQYTIIDILQGGEAEWRRLLGKLEEFTTKNIVQPIPYVRFDGVNIREALSYIQKAKHIGKVVCVMPEIKQGIQRETGIHTPMFHKNSTYLITGGLGGIGFEVCKWMVKGGANYVMLAGRNQPNQKMVQEINLLNEEHECNVHPLQLDVSSYEQCKELIKFKIANMHFPELRGVMHVAGTLNDGLIQNQTWESLSSTLSSKVDGTLNLHELTKDNSKLEHFVLFSSMASLLGSPGQSNHSAGNNFEDKFAHYRNSIGLPATSINWGQWGQVGVAADIDLPLYKPMTNLKALSGLEYALRSQRVQVAVCEMDASTTLTKIYPNIRSYVDELYWKSDLNSVPGAVLSTPGSIRKQLEAAESRERKVEIVKDNLRPIIRNILKLDETDVIEDKSNLHEIGVDSLMFVEIRNEFQFLLGERVILNASTFRDSSSLQTLADALVNLIDAIDLTAPPTVPTSDQV